MLIFAARRKSRARRCPIFSALWIECFTSQCCLTSLSSFFPVAETRSLHQDIVITRGVHFSASPDRRVDPSTAIGRGPCVLQIQLSWKQTGTTWPSPNKLTPSIVHVRLTDYGVLFPNSRLIYFIYSLKFVDTPYSSKYFVYVYFEKSLIQKNFCRDDKQ